MAGWRPAERKAAQKAVDFFECQLCHFQGRMAGKPFLLELWQEAIIRQLFGRLRKDGTRLYRTAYIEIPRKNGKSTLAAGIALYLLAEDGESGAEVYSAAGDRSQARIVFATALQMVQSSPALKERVLSFRNEMETADGGKYRVLSADADRQHGLNVSGAVVDEVHTQPHRDLWDVLVTGTGARDQPMVVAITTAGFDRNSICWELHERARKIIAGEIVNESFFAVIYGADPEDDWTSETTWKKANPNLGVSLKLDYLREKFEEARTSPAFENTFRRLHLDQWTTQENRFLPMERWNQCGGIVDQIGLRGRPAFSGLDLSSSLDVTAFVLVIPGNDGVIDVIPHFFLPSQGIRERSQREGVPYDQWAKAGYLTLTEGEVVDYGIVREAVVACSKMFDLKEVAFDRWGAGQISQELDSFGITVVPFGQGYGSMSTPTKELLSMVLGRRIRHGSNPILTWMAECTTVTQDPAGNIKPVKPDRRKNASRIDGIVALVMALDRATRHMASLVGGVKGRSMYENDTYTL